MSLFFGILSLFTALTLTPTNSHGKNLHLIDGDTSTGFEIYRTGKPSKADIKELCKLGVTEMMVLSGDAQKVEIKYSSLCPGLKVIYNYAQKVKTPLTKDFLGLFDQWVEQSHALGKKIAFRCSCGCHRTGRLAAYYRMKYSGYGSDAAIDEMNDLGKWMFLYPSLKKQVRALEDFLADQPCGQKAKYCIK